MANLFWKKGKKTTNLISVPFKTEEEFEKIVFETKELFSDIHLLQRQVRGGNKNEIPDIIGIDQDGTVCIIEMKNVEVNESIIPQVLKYAIWAKGHPDSIKNLWHEANQPDVDIDWNEYDVKIMVMAPSIDANTLKFSDSITFPIELIEIKRWVEGKDSFLLINQLEIKETPRARVARGLRNYDQAFYEQYRNKNSVKYFMKFIQETDFLNKQHNWNLEKKFNRNYCSFKYGFFNIIQIRWMGSKTFALTFKIPENIAKRVQGNMKMEKYKRGYAFYYIDNPEKVKINSFIKLMKQAIENAKTD